MGNGLENPWKRGLPLETNPWERDFKFVVFAQDFARSLKYRKHCRGQVCKPVIYRVMQHLVALRTNKAPLV